MASGRVTAPSSEDELTLSDAAPADAAEGTIRAKYAKSVGENSVHGSDAPETAKEEIAYFFSGLELVG